MTSMKHVAGIAVLMASTTLAANARGETYTVKDLGTLGGSFSQPFIISRAGVVGGGATNADNAQNAVVWSQGQVSDLGTLGGPNSTVFGLNDRGVASGAAEATTSDPNGEDFCGYGTHLTCLPVVWRSGVVGALPTLGGANGVGLRNNDSGAVAGYAETATPDTACPSPQILQFLPTIWEGGKAEALPTARNDRDGVAMGINEYGVVVGASGACVAYNANTGLYLQPRHALMWSLGKATDLGTLGGRTGAAGGNIAWAVNKFSQIVGISDLAGDKTFHAFLWQAGKMSDLGAVSGDVDSAAISINDRGVIVGLSISASGATRAAIWRDGKARDLNALAKGAPLYLLTGCSINARGQITGLGLTSDGDVHTYLATPNS